MLTYAQVQTAAYQGEGVIYHPNCAAELYSTLTLEKADSGLTNVGGLTPVIQYDIYEWAGEDAWNLADEKAYDWASDHPALAALLGVANANSTEATEDTRNRWRLLDRLSERYADIAGPTCDHCGKAIN